MFPITHLLTTVGLFFVAAWVSEIPVASVAGGLLLVFMLIGGFFIDLDHSGDPRDLVVCSVKMDSAARECIDAHRGIIHQKQFGLILLWTAMAYLTHLYLDGVIR